VLPPISTGFKPVLASITSPFSLILAHAPDLNHLTVSVLALYHESLQVAAHPCWKWVFPNIIFAILMWVLGTIPRGTPAVLLLASLPLRAVDMLTVRIEQLTVEGLSPSKIRGLAGRS